MRGRLVVFEGGEGVGKSTQLRRLAARLEAAGVPHRLFREPGGTRLGDEIRRILLESSHAVGARAEAALFVASRAQLVEEQIRPALQRGEHVLLDRFMLSTYAYQSAGRGIPLDEIRNLNAFAVEGIVPSLTILLSLADPADGLLRAGRRGKHDRIESAETEFHWHVQLAFETFASDQWQVAHPECGAIVSVDASGNEDLVEQRVNAALRTALPMLFAETGARA